MTTIQAARRSKASTFILGAGVLLIAANLRAPFTSVAPLLDTIRATFALNMAQAGMLTTLPLLTFAAISPFSARLAREYGLERALFGALILMAGGIAIRSLGPVWCLYLGTLGMGAGIAIGNVLLPSLVKRDFPQSVAMLTGAYVVTMGVAAAIASMLVVPLARIPAIGWQFALGAAILLPLATILLWLPQLASHTRPAVDTASPPHARHIWHSALAWQITLFMGLNSTIYYVVVGWLPSILADSGYSATQAGSIHGLMQFASALPGLFIGLVVVRLKNQKMLAAGASLLAALSFAGLLVRPDAAALWVICFGIGSGTVIILSLIFFVLRTRTPQDAAALSGMAQGLGYLLAAAGPAVAGLLHDGSGGWGLPLIICIGLSIMMMAAGYLAGRPLQIQS